MDVKMNRIRQRMSADGGPPPGRLPKPDVVLASYEAVCADIMSFKAIHWEAVVVDIRQRARGAHLSRVQATVNELSMRHCVLLAHSRPPLPLASDELLALLGIVRPVVQELADVLGPGADSMEEVEVCAKLKALLEPHSCRVQGSAAHPPRPISKEVLLPTRLVPLQAQAYYTALARFYPLLTDNKSFTHHGYRLSQLKQMCTDLCKVCNHPHLVLESEAQHLQQQQQQAGAPQGQNSGAKPNEVAAEGGAARNADAGPSGGNSGGPDVGGDAAAAAAAAGAASRACRRGPSLSPATELTAVAAARACPRCPCLPAAGRAATEPAAVAAAAATGMAAAIPQLAHLQQPPGTIGYHESSYAPLFSSCQARGTKAGRNLEAMEGSLPGLRRTSLPAHLPLQLAVHGRQPADVRGGCGVHE
uniref:SNF2 N-terminal domain-containing protein n=1 Tax=Dunaliella tertiolecta TaxID=3047 RepID=A0A7S3VN50_DUNTE